MSDRCTQFSNQLINAYSRWYDITRCDQSDAPLLASAVFHEHGSSYIISKKAKMWEINRNEYLYLFSTPHLTQALAEECIAKARALGEPLVQPGKDHMSSYVVAVILCDTADEDAVETVKRYRHRKSFQFSLQGWMEVHTALVELGKDSVVSNPDGRQTAKFLKSVLHPPKQGGLLHKLLRK
jgi:hypothetical protein